MLKKNRRFMYANMPKFQDCDELVCSIPPNRVLKKKYNIVSPVEFGIQNCLEVAGQYVTTDNPRLCHVGITHVEGGWPKDINRLDEEQTSRYRKKQEKDEAYLVQMKGLIKSCEHAIFQNNAINLYETYFEDLESADLKEEYTSKTLNLYRDHSKVRMTFSLMVPLIYLYSFYSVELRELSGLQMILIILQVLIVVSFN